MPIRKPAVAGRFYPADREKLCRSVTSYLDAAPVEPAPDRISTVVAPHAGYAFSGATAGHAFRRARGMAPNRVVILGPSHHFQFDGLSIHGEGSWETPLGSVPVDRDFTAALTKVFGSVAPEAHGPEHAIEVELPFLQLALEPGFSIVPVLTGSPGGPLHQALATWLATHVDRGDLIVASSDLSHFMEENDANAVDRYSLDTLLAGEPDRFLEGVRSGACALCGATAVGTALSAANQMGAIERTLWDYRTSGQASGDYSRVVGYGAVTFEQPEA